MPSYANEELLTEDIRVKISPTVRHTLEAIARQRKQSLNRLVRESRDDWLRVHARAAQDAPSCGEDC